MQQASPKAACILRKSVASPEDTTTIAVRAPKDVDGHPIRGSSVTVYADGTEVAEVDWLAESPSAERLYRAVAYSGVEDVLAGGRASFIAYGQAGSGKSSTLLFHETAEGARAGLLPRAAMHLFAELPASCVVQLSCVELYNDTLYDCLLYTSPSPRDS